MGGGLLNATRTLATLAGHQPSETHAPVRMLAGLFTAARVQRAFVTTQRRNQLCPYDQCKTRGATAARSIFRCGQPGCSRIPLERIRNAL